jgi:uncharacterized membrane protein
MNSADYRGARSHAAPGACLIQPMLVVFPIVLLAGVLATDPAVWRTADHFWVHASGWLLAVGMILEAVVADLGLIAFIAVSRGRSRTAGCRDTEGSSPEHLILQNRSKRKCP